MSWNYRVVKAAVTNELTGTTEEMYHVREVYYDDTGKPTGYCGASVSNWETVEDLKSSVELMRQAFDKPVVEQRDFMPVPA